MNVQIFFCIVFYFSVQITNFIIKPAQNQNDVKRYEDIQEIYLLHALFMIFLYAQHNYFARKQYSFRLYFKGYIPKQRSLYKGVCTKRREELLLSRILLYMLFALFL